MKVILLSGAEATCKSTIAENLATKLDVVYCGKDKIKETLFDSEMHTTWDFSWYELRAKKIFFDDIKTLVDANNDFIVESNFIGSDKKWLERSLSNGAKIYEIHCYTKGLTSFYRAFMRNETGRRHPGHHDRRWYLKILAQASMHSIGIDLGAHKPVALSSNILQLDTTDPRHIDYDKIIEFIS